jgi:hypothetical protein
MKISESFPQQGDMNSHEEWPNVICGPYVEDQDDVIPPFYITLNMHDKMLHNCMLDSGASHNLMQKIVMEKLGLDITRPYQDLYSFDAKKVKCMGVIEDMVVTLAQPYEKCDNGYSCGRCPCQLWFVVVYIFFHTS